MPTDSSESSAVPAINAVSMAPAWLLSLAVHLLLAIAASVMLSGDSRAVPLEEPGRRGEIVLTDRNAEQPRYFSEFESSDRHQVLRPTSMSSKTNAGTVESSLSDSLPDVPPLIPGIELPQRSASAAASPLVAAIPQAGGFRGRPRIPVSPLDEAAILAEDALVPREQIPTGPTAQMSLFGSPPAAGRSFVFVIDRSSSMGSGGLGAIQTAAKELSARLVQLNAEQKFQVIAYNEAAEYLTSRELIPATDQNKRSLLTFIANLAAYGQTGHRRGLSAALRLKPEVIFLLTDGGDPPLTPGELLAIREENAGHTAIHCIRFGRGPQPPGADIFQRLAAQNRGSFSYVDMNSR